MIEINSHAFERVPLERHTTVIESFSNAPVQIKEVINKYWDSLNDVEEQTLEFNEETGELEKVVSKYCSNFNERYIIMDRKKQNDEFGIVFRHEYGHYIDDMIGHYSESESFKESFQMDKELFNNATDKGIENINNMLYDLSENIPAFESRYVSDIISALTNNDTKIRKEYNKNYMDFFGHEWGQCKDELMQNEIFANIFAIYTENNSNVLEFTEKWFPNLTQQFQIGISKVIEYNRKELIKI